MSDVSLCPWLLSVGHNPETCAECAGRRREHQDRLMAAATTVRTSVTHECARLTLGEGELLHMVVMTWVNDYVDAGLIGEDDEDVDAVTKAMADLAGKLLALQQTRGS